jgi:putative DNA primase/helicase
MRLRNEEVKHYEHQQKKQIDLNTLPGADNRIADIGNVIRFDLDRRGFKTKTLNNCVLFCRTDTGLCAAVRYNLFSNAIEIIRPLPWHCNRASTLPVWVDEDTLLLKLYLANRTQLEFSTVTCFEAITATALINPVHPVREYLSGLKWDGMPRLETWLTKIAECADTEYTRMVQSLLIRAAVNRVLRPGCKYDHMVILESVQGAGKSRLVSVLGGAWYSDAFIDPGSRDTVDQIQGKWFVEIPEMKMVGSDDVDSIKAFITRQTDRARLAYARITRDYPRQCVFVGTINPLEVGYLKDETGNRRFLPVWCGSEHFNLSWLEDNRDQLFAEAVKKAGEPIWIMEKLEGDAQAEVDRRMIQDPYYEIISNYLKLNPNKNALSTVMVYETILGGAPKNMKRLDQMRIGRVLRSLGYVRRYIRTNRYTGTIYEKVGCREPDPIKLVKTSGWEQKEESIIDEEALGGLEGVFE